MPESRRTKTPRPVDAGTMTPPRRPRRLRRRPGAALRLLALAGALGPGGRSVTDATATHRFASSLAQRGQSPADYPFAAATTPARRLDGQYAADDAYVNAGAADYDDDVVMQQAGVGDDGYLALDDVDFGEVSIMPVSCVNYHNGHMIKFQFFEKSSSLNCHFKNLGTFVVSIAHYMRAYFNYEALTRGDEFGLPGDVGFLNCVMLKETQNDEYPLYAKIGCQHRDTYTSTKLQLIVYKDQQCSKEYSEDEMKGDGYTINDYYLSTKVSFRPPFYSCQSCKPEEIAASFTKQYSAWYDDDYISRQGQKQQYDAEEEEEEENDDDDEDEEKLLPLTPAARKFIGLYIRKAA